MEILEAIAEGMPTHIAHLRVVFSRQARTGRMFKRMLRLFFGGIAAETPHHFDQFPFDRVDAHGVPTAHH
jgi:hypothetical protein